MSCICTGEASAGHQTDHARVTVEGQILDTPCSIDPGSQEQTISMGTTSVGVIAREGTGRPVPFSVTLRDCSPGRYDQRLPDWRGFSIMFDGASDGSDFAVSGPAGGIALRIFDANGSRAAPGRPLPDGQLVQGDQTLNFKMQLVGNHRPLVKGDYRTVIHFGISYF